MAKTGQRFGARAVQGRQQLRRLVHQPHATPAAARHGLDHERKADALRLGDEGLIALVLAKVPGQAGHALRQRQGFRGRLAAQRADGGGRRADPDEPGVDHGLGEVGVFTQEAVAGVHGVGAGGARGFKQLVHAQVGIGRGQATERERGARFAHM
ncbi:hypothetical protein FQZ97_841310 [compost metagenome]